MLYDLKPEYDSLAELDPEGADLGDDLRDLTRELDAIREELKPKLLSLAKVVRTLEAEAGLLEEHGRALMGRASSKRVRVDYLKHWMQLQMEGAELERLRDPFVTLWLQKSSPSVAVLNEEAVPTEYKRVTMKLPLSAVPTGMLGPDLRHRPHRYPRADQGHGRATSRHRVPLRRAPSAHPLKEGSKDCSGHQGSTYIASGAQNAIQERAATGLLPRVQTRRCGPIQKAKGDKRAFVNARLSDEMWPTERGWVS
jgi:hypothetical protein